MKGRWVEGMGVRSVNTITIAVFVTVTFPATAVYLLLAAYTSTHPHACLFTYPSIHLIYIPTPDTGVSRQLVLSIHTGDCGFQSAGMVRCRESLLLLLGRMWFCALYDCKDVRVRHRWTSHAGKMNTWVFSRCGIVLSKLS